MDNHSFSPEEVKHGLSDVLRVEALRSEIADSVKRWPAELVDEVAELVDAYYNQKEADE